MLKFNFGMEAIMPFFKLNSSMNRVDSLLDALQAISIIINFRIGMCAIIRYFNIIFYILPAQFNPKNRSVGML